MDSYMTDIAKLVGTKAAEPAKTAKNSTNKNAGKDLDFNDFLMLMVEQFKNQSIDSQTDTSEMLGQMVQMSVIEAINNISTIINDSSTMTYAASLVGKKVTVGKYTEGSKVPQEISGTVTGTGTLNGKQVIFLDDKDCYYLSDIMAVGKLPDNIDKVDPDGEEDSGTENQTKPDQKTANL